MNIVYLVESATGIWGGVKIIFEQANLLTARKHQVTILSKSEPPAWFDLQCDFRTVPSFDAEHVPEADIVIGTFWTTVPAAAECGRGVPVHLVQGYEGDNSAFAAHRAHIEHIYAQPIPKITISRHLDQVVRERFGQTSTLVRYMVDHRTMYPNAGGPRQRAKGEPVRLGLVGPCDVDWKDIPTGLEACRLAYSAGLDLQLVRITNTTPHELEQDLPYPVEWHERVDPTKMGELYRSMDVFLGTSRGNEEGFFLPAVEAMACGVPTVLTDIPCFRGYGEGQYSLFVDPQDPAAMAEALVIASGHPRVREELHCAGLQIAQQYTPENHIQDLEQALEAILAERGVALVQQEADSSDSELGEDLHKITQHIALALQGASDVYLRDSDFEQALRHLEAASHILPDDPTLERALVRTRGLAGRP